MPKVAYVPAASVAVLLASAPGSAHAADLCPAPPKRVVTRDVVIPAEDHRLYVESDSALLSEEHGVFTGHVRARQDDRIVAADAVEYDQKTGRVTVKGSVNFQDPKLRVDSASGVYDTIGAASFDQADFQILDRHGRGHAREISVAPDGIIDLSQVDYTTCPPGNRDWLLEAGQIDLDTGTQQGIARHVLMRFKDVPVFYTPYLSFPLGDERKSGLLFPVIGHSGSNGLQLEVPYYFNLAPNYDLTLTPGVLSARGEQLAGEFRYLTPSSSGKLEASFLPNDAQRRSDRSYLHYTDVTDLERGLRFDADIASVSDVNYFQDFAVGSDQTSVTYLERRAELKYYDDVWRVRAELQNWQTIDNLVTPLLRPYSRVPAVQAEGLMPLWSTPLEFVLDGEAVNFLREAGPRGIRLDASPELRWSSRGPGYFFEPAVGYHFTQYELYDTTPGEPSAPSRSLPYARVDSGLVFERDNGAGQRAQTLEPRLMYSYTPYRNQDALPIFDTGLPDLNLVELFRSNRYVGDDRISDANQVAAALTTRLFDPSTGAEYLAATLGQIHYFTPPRVDLPPGLLQSLATGFTAPPPPRVNQFLLPGPYQYIWSGNGAGMPMLVAAPPNLAYALPGASATPAQIASLYGGSDVVAEVTLTSYHHFGVDMAYQWNPYTSQTDKSEVSVQYRPDPTRIVNIGYRFQAGILKQWDGSFAWPITDRWSSVGRWVYSIPDHQTIEQVAGFSYRSCCWRLELVQRRYLTNRLGGLDTSIALQLELTGLSSVGKPADSFLEQEIRGYSVRDAQLP